MYETWRSPMHADNKGQDYQDKLDELTGRKK